MKIIMLIISGLMLLFCALMIGFAVQERHYNERSIELSARHMKYTDIATGLAQGSHTLTEEVRLFAETGYIEHLRNYFKEAKEDRNRDKAMTMLAKITATEEAAAYIDASMNCSIRLMDREYYSMRLTSLAYDIPEEVLPIEVSGVTLSEEDKALSVEDMKDKARTILFDREYMDMKRRITNGTSRFLDAVQEDAEKEYLLLTQKVEYYAHLLQISIFGLTILIVFMTAFQYINVIHPIAVASDNIRSGKSIKMPLFLEETEALSTAYNKLLSDNAALVEKLRVSAETDALTGLGNRTAYNIFCKKLFTAGGKVTLFVFDVNDLRVMNNTHGHEDGDKLLKISADCIARTFGEGDAKNCFRIGGDEFAAFLCGRDAHEAEAYIKAFSAEIKREGVKVAVGYYCAEDVTKVSLHQIFEEADKMMYLDKERLKTTV
ncbi:MAG: GGDEF domain-containing protein [Clostridia bacterium]|nr:GGDEF domain-containing protein [Clostridia bacterium]